MRKEDYIYELITKALSSQTSAEEQAILDKELSKDDELKSNFLFIKEYWNNYYSKNQTHSIIEKTEKKLGFSNAKKTNNKIVYRLIASILLIVSMGYSTSHLVKSKPKVELNEYSCSAGEIKEITLSDGTKVWLNSMSLLIAAEPFKGETREVKLFGEGFFEVKADPEHPFLVKTHLLNTKVVGTHFNVVAYPTDKVHEIALYEGKVQLNAENRINTITLKPGERAYFTKISGKIRVLKTDLGKPAKWRDGILRFYDEDLFSITKKLERKYHTRIFVADSLVGDLRYTAEFEEETVERVLLLLSEAQEFSYEISNNGIIIKSKT